MIANNRAGHRRPAPWTDHPRTWYTLERWRRLRRHQLNKQPVCEMCLERGLVRVATVADHIEDHRNWNEFLTGKLRSLCRECHEIRHGRLLVPTEIGEDGWPKQSGGGPQQSTTLAQVACGRAAALGTPEIFDHPPRVAFLRYYNQLALHVGGRRSRLVPFWPAS